MSDNEWRRLALQFDGHRMQAIAHLKCMLQDPQAHREAAEAFLSAGPLSGEKVLAERIAQLAAPVAPKGGERHKVPCTSRDAICAQPAYCHANGCKEPTMVCSKCGSDRFKEDCKGDRMQCDIRGTAQGERQPVTCKYPNCGCNSRLMCVFSC